MRHLSPHSLQGMQSSADTTDPNFLQAIPNAAGFHFPIIEQGGDSLYPLAGTEGDP